MRVFLAAVLCCAAAAPAWAQFRDCSATIGTGAAAVTFTGRSPTQYIEICNAHATNTVGVNVVGGTAAIGGAGTRTLTAGQCWQFRPPLPLVISTIASAVTTTTACQFQ
jgi:hypothetical protein